MNEIEKLSELYDEIDSLISQKATATDLNFVRWHKKLERFLSKHYGEQSNEYINFYERDFTPVVFSLNGYSTDYVGPCKKGLEITKIELAIYLDELEEISFNETKEPTAENNQNTCINFSKVFIVHGHNEALKQSVARLIEKQGIGAVILHEQPNQGATIIEKFEKNCDVGAAICLFSADDVGKAKDEQQENDRARQNVVFEAGFFMGKLGRDHVMLIAEQGVELPSDLKGVVYTNSSSWQFEVLKELRAMGFQVDYNKIV